jgi:hypothetical protein
MFKVIWRWFFRLSFGLSALTVAVLATLLAFGPQDAFRTALQQYQIAYDAQDGALIAALTAPSDLAFFEEQRQHALTSPKPTVEALPFHKRATVLTLRANVLRGYNSLEDLTQVQSGKAFASTYSRLSPSPQAVKSMQLLFALPTGRNSARGYVTPPDMERHFFVDHLMSVYRGVYLEMEWQNGRWLMSPLPMVANNMAEIEAIAKRLDTTGNRFLFRFMLGSRDPSEVERLWKPLLVAQN